LFTLESELGLIHHLAAACHRNVVSGQAAGASGLPTLLARNAVCFPAPRRSLPGSTP